MHLYKVTATDPMGRRALFKYVAEDIQAVMQNPLLTGEHGLPKHEVQKIQHDKDCEFSQRTSCWSKRRSQENSRG